MKKIKLLLAAIIGCVAVFSFTACFDCTNDIFEVAKAADNYIIQQYKQGNFGYIYGDPVVVARLSNMGAKDCNCDTVTFPVDFRRENPTLAEARDRNYSILQECWKVWNDKRWEIGGAYGRIVVVGKDGSQKQFLFNSCSTPASKCLKNPYGPKL